MMNYGRILESLYYTVAAEVEELEESFGYELNQCYVAGSFATHLFFKRYAFNDIDVFIVNPTANPIRDGVHDTNYEIMKSYKVPLNDYYGREVKIGSHSKVEVNFVVVTNCCCLAHLIKFFDINCCQVGFKINLETLDAGRFVFTEHFEQFRKSRILKVVAHHTPASSLMRVMNKSSQMNLPYRLSAEHLLKLKWEEDVLKVVQKKLFTRVYTLLQIDQQENIIQDNFNVEVLERLSEEEDNDSYNGSNSDETSFSFSFLKKGAKVEITFHGNRNNLFHFACINGDVDKFTRFKTLIEENGALNALVRDELMLTSLDYILGSSERTAIDCNNFVIVKLMEEYMSI